MTIKQANMWKSPAQLSQCFGRMDSSLFPQGKNGKRETRLMSPGEEAGETSLVLPTKGRGSEKGKGVMLQWKDGREDFRLMLWVTGRHRVCVFPLYWRNPMNKHHHIAGLTKTRRLVLPAPLIHGETEIQGERTSSGSWKPFVSDSWLPPVLSSLPRRPGWGLGR